MQTGLVAIFTNAEIITMKKLLLLASLLFTSPALAAPTFRYETPCALENNDGVLMDTCVVIETRENNGALRTRNIFSNRFGLTVKSWFDDRDGFMTWDSYNNFSYKWEYKIGRVNGTQGWSMVMPGVYLQSVSWD